MFCVLKRTISLRWFFWVPTTYVLIKKKSNFQLNTLSWEDTPNIIGPCPLFHELAIKLQNNLRIWKLYLIFLMLSGIKDSECFCFWSMCMKGCNKTITFAITFKQLDLEFWYFTGTKLAQNFREKWLLPAGKLGRSDSHIGRSYRAKLQHFLSI